MIRKMREKPDRRVRILTLSAGAVEPFGGDFHEQLFTKLDKVYTKH